MATFPTLDALMNVAANNNHPTSTDQNSSAGFCQTQPGMPIVHAMQTAPSGPQLTVTMQGNGLIPTQMSQFAAGSNAGPVCDNSMSIFPPNHTMQGVQGDPSHHSLQGINPYQLGLQQRQHTHRVSGSQGVGSMHGQPPVPNLLSLQQGSNINSMSLQNATGRPIVSTPQAMQGIMNAPFHGASSHVHNMAPATQHPRDVFQQMQMQQGMSSHEAHLQNQQLEFKETLASYNTTLQTLSAIVQIPDQERTADQRDSIVKLAHQFVSLKHQIHVSQGCAGDPDAYLAEAAAFIEQAIPTPAPSNNQRGRGTGTKTYNTRTSATRQSAAAVSERTQKDNTAAQPTATANRGSAKTALNRADQALTDSVMQHVASEGLQANTANNTQPQHKQQGDIEEDGNQGKGSAGLEAAGVVQTPAPKGDVRTNQATPPPDQLGAEQAVAAANQQPSTEGEKEGNVLPVFEYVEGDFKVMEEALKSRAPMDAVGMRRLWEDGDTAAESYRMYYPVLWALSGQKKKNGQFWKQKDIYHVAAVKFSCEHLSDQNVYITGDQLGNRIGKAETAFRSRAGYRTGTIKGSSGGKPWDHLTAKEQKKFIGESGILPSDQEWTALEQTYGTMPSANGADMAGDSMGEGAVGPSGVRQHSVTAVNWTRLGKQKGTSASAPTDEEIAKQKQDLKQELGDEYEALMKELNGDCGEDGEDLENNGGQQRGTRGSRGRGGKPTSPGTRAMTGAISRMGQQLAVGEVRSSRALQQGLSSFSTGMANAMVQINQQGQDERRRQHDLHAQELEIRRSELALREKELLLMHEREMAKIKARKKKKKSHRKKRKSKHNKRSKSGNASCDSAQSPVKKKRRRNYSSSSTTSSGSCSSSSESNSDSQRPIYESKTAGTGGQDVRNDTPVTGDVNGAATGTRV